MKTIGLIGGMGWESSKLYYERINKKANEVLGGSHSAKIIMVSVDFAEIEKLTFANDWHAIGKIVAKSAIQLEKAGAEMVVLCTNLIHIVSETIIKNISIPFLHIADATGEVIEKQNLKKILLLGTKYTMEKDFYTKTLEKAYGLEIVIPKTKDRDIVHAIIYKELLKGKFTDTSKRAIIKIIKESQIGGVEGVILGCTELPMLVGENDVAIPTFDTGEIHVNKAIKIATNEDEGAQKDNFLFEKRGIVKGIKFNKNHLTDEKIENECEELNTKVISSKQKPITFIFRFNVAIFFANYVNAMSKWLFHDSGCKYRSNKSDIGRMIHK
ncbi:aspartate/glutamate racemase family protein [Jejuia spongiicola]|uniref:Aspartate/glutamate racemase family protein n=1 Tax=Jejuia spongiicola TaxID=2942207 RepID=A0ABT0QL79_9FLAO|nr:aspartate/glutamate racemase family protein [Jejuia spongiicola]MCL6296710.1 aspartate/glutamate racemase family protein [Jejuia spongiicola]